MSNLGFNTDNIIPFSSVLYFRLGFPEHRNLAEHTAHLNDIRTQLLGGRNICTNLSPQVDVCTHYRDQHNLHAITARALAGEQIVLYTDDYNSINGVGWEALARTLCILDNFPNLLVVFLRTLDRVGKLELKLIGEYRHYEKQRQEERQARWEYIRRIRRGRTGAVGRPPLSIDRAEVVRLRGMEMRVEDIAKRVGCSAATVSKILKEEGVGKMYVTGERLRRKGKRGRG